MVAEPPDDDHDDGTSAVLGSSRRSASAFPPAPGSDRDAASSSSFVDAFRRDFWLYAVFFLLTAAQALPLTAIQHLLNRELGLEDHPETINRFFAVEFAVSTLKPAYAAVSDLCPIRGRRRVPYMVLGAAAYALALQLFARVRTTPQLYAAGVFGVACYAACESAADGVLVSVSRTNERDALAREDHLEENHRSARAMRAQALGMTVRSAGSFFATATSIPLLAVVDARTAVSAAGAFAVLAAFAAARVDEPEPLARSRPARREHRPPDASVGSAARPMPIARIRPPPATSGSSSRRRRRPRRRFFLGREASPRTSHRRRGASLRANAARRRSCSRIASPRPPS